MSDGCGFKCAKYLLFVFNFIFWCAGAVLLGIGIWFLVDTNALKILNVTSFRTTDDLVRAAAITIVVVGSLVFIVGGLGCFGACTESPTLLIIFSTVLFLLLAGQVTAGILAGVYRYKILGQLLNSMNTTVLVKYGEEPDTTTAWDLMQVELKCCGVYDLSEWMSTRWYQTTGQNASQTVPGSCCVLNGTGTQQYPVDPVACFSAGNNTSAANRDKYVHIKGCYPAVYDWIEIRLAIIIGVAIGLVLIQVLGITMACCVGHSIRNKNVYR